MKLLIAFLCYSSLLVAQNNVNDYLPKNLDSIKGYLEHINRNHIDKIQGKFSSEIKKAYKDRDENIINRINDSVYFFNSEIKENLHNILEVIYNANPEIETKDFNFFIKNSSIPNATCYGNGLFDIHMGLFTALDSDDELASVICHEIAHYVLNHSIKSVTKRVSLINSKATKKKIKAVEKQKYGRTRAGLLLVDALSINMLERSKRVEAEADSLGYVLFSKTNYKPSHAISSLNKLKDVDDMTFHHDVKLDSTFNFKNYEFKSYWLKENTSIFDTEEAINEFKLVSDTIKTHPEIPYRVEKLIKEFGISSKTEVGDKNNITKIKTIVNPQSIIYTIDFKRFDIAIYQLIEKFDNKLIDENFYYISMAKILRKIYEAKKNHELGKYVPPKNKFSDEKHLNTIRLFLNNLELFEVKKLGLAFCEAVPSKISNDKAFKKHLQFFQQK